MNKELLTAIENAEFVLIGIGEEWNDKFSDMENDHIFGRIDEQLKENKDRQWSRPFFFREYLKTYENEKRKEGYRKLYELVRSKKHFIVSICINGEISKGGFPFSVVEPCGGYELLQCSVNCSDELYEVSKIFQREIQVAIETLSLNDLEQPMCSRCGAPLVFHNIYAPHYSEAGYLENWKIYTEWLQKTVNRNICVLELGVGMEFPSVIRWPFEKIVYYNNKAKLFRIHAKLSQISEEIKESGYSIQKNSIDFINNLSCGY